jgi:Transposase DDE domain
VPSIPDYSTIGRRINRLDIKINERLGNDIVIALDSNGIKVANRETGYDTNGMLEKVT